MERLNELISKLKEQFDKGADAEKLLGITMLIERELTKPQAQQQFFANGHGPTEAPVATASKVAVVMPAARKVRHEEPEVKPIPKPKTEPVFFHENIADAVEEVNEPAPAKAPAREPKLQPAPQLQAAQEFAFDPITEIPTLSQQHTAKEINEMLALRDASLNDKLKENKIEVGHILKDHPIKDLKRAIGINDRYVFINELFRGDEVMYERSLKTINSFRIYAEAEYWIERELKVKLGWKENEEVTHHFYQLVRRRFS